MPLVPHQLANCFSDITRLRITALLHLSGELCVCEIVDCLGIPQPRVSKHLAILRSNGVIRARRQGQWIHYRTDPEIPAWGNLVIEHLVAGCTTRSPYREDIERLQELSRSRSCA